MTPTSLPTASSSNLRHFRQLLQENQNSLLNPSPGEIPPQLYSALDEIESAVVRERARVLFGEIVASRRAGLESGAREQARSWFERLLCYLEGPTSTAAPAVAH